MEDDDALERLIKGRLPIPCRDRFQPLRLGLYGIWEYDEQEFYFHDGRLILRGHNGSGKTKVLEVSSPFLFDGELTARRLDPFGNAARSMRDNLLYRGLRHRVGYICCEYGRIDGDGEAHYLTIGAGLYSLATRPGAPESWFFVTPLRVGLDFSLYDAGRTPHSKNELTKILGETAIVSTAKEYRAKVARELFGFAPGRLRSLVELLLALRRPKLSEDFDLEKLQRLLRDSLPPVNGRLFDDFASRFDVLARDREELDDLQEIQRSVSEFLTIYRVFARRAVRAAAEAVTRAETQLSESNDKVDQAEKTHTRLSQNAEGLEGRKKALEGDRDTGKARLAELELRPEMAEHGRLEELREQVTGASERMQKANTVMHQADSVHQGHLRKSSELVRNLQTALAELERVERRSRELAETTMLADIHHAETISLREEPRSVEQVLLSQVEAHAKTVADALPLVEQVRSAQEEYRVRKELHEDIESRRDLAQEQRDDRADDHTVQIDLLCARIATWSAGCTELQLTDDQVAALQGAAQAAGELGNRPVSMLVAEFTRPFETALALADANTRTDRERTAIRQAELVLERDRVATGPDPEPAPPPVARRSRAEAVDGAPFWAVVDFLPDLDPGLAAHVEAALLGAGLLDAWVTEDGRILTEGPAHESVVVPPGAITGGGDLTEVLRGVRHPHVAEDHVQRLLASISYSPGGVIEGPGTAIGGDGSWRIGPVHGRTAADHASFIGPAARDAERQRRLSILDRELAGLVESMEECDHTLAELARRSGTLDNERSGTDLDDAGVRTTLAGLTAAKQLLSDMEAELGRATIVLLDRAAKVAGAESVLADYARVKRLPGLADAILAEHEALIGYRASLHPLFREAIEWSTLRQNAEEATVEAEGSAFLLEQLKGNLDHSESELRSFQAKLDQRMALVGADVTTVLGKIEAAKKTIGDHEADLAWIGKQIVETAGDLGKSEGAAKDARREQDERSVARDGTVMAYQGLVRQGLVSLALGTDTSPETLAETIQAAKDATRLLAGEEWHEKARNLARDDVDRQFRLLETALSGPDWQPRSVNDGGVVLVRLVHNSTPIDVPDALARIDAEISTRMSFIDEEEHDLFRQVLLGRVGEHLRQRRVEADRLIERMNRLLGARRTASGMRLEVIWESGPDQDPEVRAALRTLDRQAAEYLPDDAQDQLIAFLVKLVADARTRTDVTDWKTSLREVLDYRSWGRIRIRYQSAAGKPWMNLTNHTHQLGSGGEKAVTLQLPLFVAAAAHYAGAAPTAPRPIYLDEAFAGIDQHMRGECLGLLTDLDLDLVLASHDEFGFHPEVPGVATYELFRDPEVEGVLTTPMLWDGQRRHELRDPALIPDAFDATGTIFEDEDDDWEDPAEDADPEA